MFQLSRFCAVGLLCFCVCTAVLWGLCEYGHLNYSLAFAVSFVVGSALGYSLNGRFTFAGGRLNRAGLSRYLLVNGALFVINSILLRVLVESYHVWYLAATVLLAALNLPISFVAHQLISYRIARSIVSGGAGSVVR